MRVNVTVNDDSIVVESFDDKFFYIENRDGTVLHECANALQQRLCERLVRAVKGAT